MKKIIHRTCLEHQLIQNYVKYSPKQSLFNSLSKFFSFYWPMFLKMSILAFLNPIMFFCKENNTQSDHYINYVTNIPF